VLIAVTWEAARTAPDESETVPTMAPVAAVCPKRGKLPSRIRIEMTTSLEEICLCIGDSSREKSFGFVGG
jgi:hypothetical protein